MWSVTVVLQRTVALAADLSDAASDRRLYAAAAGLVLLGTVVLVATVWWWRSTRPEPPALGALETMTTRRWRSADEVARGEMLERARRSGRNDAEAASSDAIAGGASTRSSSETPGSEVPLSEGPSSGAPENWLLRLEASEPLPDPEASPGAGWKDFTDDPLRPDGRAGYRGDHG